MKKVLVYALAFIFVSGIAGVNVNAQENKPEVKKEMKDTTKKKQAKGEKKGMRKESGNRKGTKVHHKAPVRKGEAKKDTTKNK
jgi:hypothetical protein